MVKKAYFSFGRFQPPTIGHGLLIEEVGKLAQADGADAYIFVSSTKDKKKNPLTAEQKVNYLNKMHPTAYAKIINTTEFGYTTPVTVAERLYEMGYTEIVALVGSDRVAAFSRMFAKAHPYVSVDKVGSDRKEANNGTVKSISGTKMRKAAVEGNVLLFKRGTKIGSMTDADVMSLMNDVRHGLGLSPFAKRVGTLRALSKNVGARRTRGNGLFKGE